MIPPIRILSAFGISEHFRQQSPDHLWSRRQVWLNTATAVYCIQHIARESEIYCFRINAWTAHRTFFLHGTQSPG